MQTFFAQSWLLWLLLALPVLNVLGWLQRRWRRHALQRLGRPELLTAQLTLQPRCRWLCGLLRVTALLALALGVAGPRWGEAETLDIATGHDLVVVLDLSRSMLAEQPSRLTVAQRLLDNLCTTLAQRGGHRVGVVLFAGRAGIGCPLTADLDHVQRVLAEQDAIHVPPSLRPPQGGPSGTRIGAGLQKALELFDRQEQKARHLLLLSDGDDPADDGEYLEGVLAAQERRLPVHVVGVGDPTLASKISAPRGGFLTFDDTVVITHVNEAVLRDIARRTQGTYIPARASNLPLGRLMEDVLARYETVAPDDDGRIVAQTPRQSWFLGTALALLLLAQLPSEGRKWQPRAQAGTRAAV